MDDGPWPKPAVREPPWRAAVAAALGLALLLGTALVILALRTEREEVTVAGFEWRRTIEVEACTTVRGEGWDVYSHGGRRNTGLDAVQWAVEMARRGAGEILLTSMDRDGTKSGFDLALTRAVSDAVPVPVIASGGVGTLDHLADGIQQGGADAVLAASIFHYGEYTVGQAKQRMAERGIPVRL